MFYENKWCHFNIWRCRLFSNFELGHLLLSGVSHVHSWILKTFIKINRVFWMPLGQFLVDSHFRARFLPFVCHAIKRKTNQSNKKSCHHLLHPAVQDFLLSFPQHLLDYIRVFYMFLCFAFSIDIFLVLISILYLNMSVKFLKDFADLFLLDCITQPNIFFSFFVLFCLFLPPPLQG